MGKRCFVIQRFDGGHYDNLYEQVFKSAIFKAGFEPYRVDKDPAASIPIESIEREISEADACFAELSEDAPNVWFEVGYAIAKEKPLCLVCSTSRAKFPFDVQHRQIITYSDKALPSDFADLGEKIHDRLASVAKKDVAHQLNVDAAKALSIGPNVSGLKAHELVALTIIFQAELTSGISGWSLKQEMERAGYMGVAANLAIVGLRRAQLIQGVQREDGNGEPFSVFFVTTTGEEWLMENQDQLNLQIETTDAEGMGITDDDIPF